MVHDLRPRSHRAQRPPARDAGPRLESLLALAAWLVASSGTLAGCAPSKSEDPSRPDLAGSESGNPPNADHEVCLDEDLCALSAQRFVNSLSMPLAVAPLRGTCVDDIGRSYCECAPADDARDPVFAWPQHVTVYGEAAEAGCLLWTRLATTLPALRSDPAQCLFREPPAVACQADACDALCEDVDASRLADAALSYDARLRFGRCGDPNNACVLVFELEGQCYARSGLYNLHSEGPFDCSLSDTAILDRAYPGWDEPVQCGPNVDC